MSESDHHLLEEHLIHKLMWPQEKPMSAAAQKWSCCEEGDTMQSESKVGFPESPSWNNTANICPV